MKKIFKYTLIISFIFLVGCDKKLTRINKNPNGVDPSSANANLILPGILSKFSLMYSELDNDITSGVVQHMQRDGWYTGYNHYTWDARDWTVWYDILRDNELLLKISQESGLIFHEGVGHIMKAFIFGIITDLWGDAPYKEALKGSEDITQPEFDSQEEIYYGVLSDLEKASELFSQNNNIGVISGNDLIYKGDANNWHKLANSLRLRYAMRLSEKKPNLAQQIIQSVFSSGIFLDEEKFDANLEYLGNSAQDSWFLASQFDSDGSNFRRRKLGVDFVNKLKELKDPRLFTWVAPVHCQWVEDLSLQVGYDEFVRKDGFIQNYRSLADEEYLKEIANGHKFTRHYNPNILGYKLDTSLYVGITIGSKAPDAYNLNPTPGQVVQNQHVSQLAPIYRQANGSFLKRRMVSSAETYFILAEAALRNWINADAEDFYSLGVKNSLATWDLLNQYNTYMLNSGVKFNNTIEQIIEQKWIASWTNSVEAWMDFRRLGLPMLKAGPASAEPVLPIRFVYGNNELTANEKNVNTAIDKLEETIYSNIRGKNSQWSKIWLLQGTPKPW